MAQVTQGELAAALLSLENTTEADRMARPASQPAERVGAAVKKSVASMAHETCLSTGRKPHA
jgi:hypothetical protein